MRPQDALATERRALAATLRAVGPDAPTLVAGWDAGEVVLFLAGRRASGVTVDGDLPGDRLAL